MVCTAVAASRVNTGATPDLQPEHMSQGMLVTKRQRFRGLQNAAFENVPLETLPLGIHVWCSLLQ
jgi:hypothetical protein